MSFILYGYEDSPYVRKIQLVLNQNNIEYELSPIAPLKLSKLMNVEVPDDFLLCSPLGKIPAINDNGFRISDSAVILQYLDKKYGSNIYPEAPEDFAKALWFQNYADNNLGYIMVRKIIAEKYVKPIIFKQTPDQAVVDRALTKNLPPMFDYFEENITGNYLLRMFSVADIAIATHFVTLKQLGIEVDKDKWPKLHNYVEFSFNNYYKFSL